jgi:hypothetical protein
MKSWGFYILAAIGFVVYAAAVEVDRDDGGAIVGDAIVGGGNVGSGNVGSGNVDAFNLQVGDCFNDAGTFVGQIVSDPSVPCSEPHDNETYAVFDVDIESYPADGNMGQLAYDACMVRFESFVGKEYDKSPLMIATMQPTAENWGQGDREVICAVFDMKAKPLVGSMAGLGL